MGEKFGKIRGVSSRFFIFSHKAFGRFDRHYVKMRLLEKTWINIFTKSQCGSFSSERLFYCIFLWSGLNEGKL